MFRRQLKARYRKPLIVMTPKSMLRVPTGTIDELTKGHFHTLIDDPAVADPKPVKTVLMCSGKIYFELAARRDALKRSDIAIVRVEQVYPFDAHLCKKILARYPGAKVTWVQEEPRNAGACMFMLDILRHKLSLDVTDISRPTSATPAVGSKGKSKYEQEAILTAAVGPLDKDAHHHDHPAPKDAHKDTQKDGKTKGTHAAPPASPAKGPKSKSGH